MVKAYKEFTINELIKGLKHISDDEKKWALFLWVYICSGKDGINKIIEFVEKEKNKVLLIEKQREEDAEKALDHLTEKGGVSDV